MAGTTTLYHYTDEEGAKAIEKEKVIKASTDTTKDAVFGPGVYLTSLGPENSTESLIQNNYDDYVPYMMETKKDKTGHVVQVEMPNEDIQNCSGNRDVKKYTGDLDLSNYEHKIYKREKNN